MFFILSKLVTTLLMPLSVVVVLFFLSFIFKKKKKPLQIASVVLFFLYSNPFLAGLAMQWWEVPPVKIEQLDENYPVGVVLCGVTNPLMEPDDRVHFQKGADRIVHTVQLYKMGKIKKILISGGSGFLLHPEESESQDLYKFAVMSGVKKKDIILENESRNTHENAHYSKKTLEENRISGKVLLITSAFHMRRAAACFKKEKVDIEIFSTDMYSSQPDYTPDNLIIPNVGAIGTWTILTKEWLGIAAYKVAGYI